VDGFLALGTSFFLSPQHRLRKRVNYSKDQGARRMAGSQRGVRLEATAAGAVGGSAQQSIGLALEPPSFDYTRVGSRRRC